jgi:hypothetical protein
METVECGLNVRPQLSIISRKIIDQQIGDMIFRRSNADICSGFPRQLANQKPFARLRMRDCWNCFEMLLGVATLADYPERRIETRYDECPFDLKVTFGFAVL